MDKEKEREFDPFSQVRIILSDVLPAEAFRLDFEKRRGGCDDQPVSDDGVRGKEKF